ncbi:energy-coupling factor transporter transmembrane component T family protein [Pseudomonas abyssi]|uniref:energy-coupling factor transporter transmembrane component T family protein n=1 Tax=Pseudomonas abyssi TaxID=170540 RepID=UPI003C7DD0E8
MTAPQRLLLALAGALGAALLQQTWQLLALLLVAGVAVLVAAVLRLASVPWLLRRVALLNLFVLLVWLTLPWHWTGGGLAWNPAGVEAAVHISLRSNIAGLLCIALLAGMNAFDVAAAAARLGMPARLAQLLLLTVRYLSVMQQTRQQVQRAMQARGFRPRCNWRTLEVLALQVALILVHALLRAERVAQAMQARGLAQRVRAPVRKADLVGVAAGQESL